MEIMSERNILEEIKGKTKRLESLLTYPWRQEESHHHKRNEVNKEVCLEVKQVKREFLVRGFILQRTENIKDFQKKHR